MSIKTDADLEHDYYVDLWLTLFTDVAPSKSVTDLEKEFLEEAL